MMPFPIATDYPGVAYDGEPTFAGLIQNYFVEYDEHHRNVGISRNWNDNTAGACLNDYERRILSSLAAVCGKEKPAHELTGEIFEQVLQKLAAEHHYSDSTLDHYRHLIALAYQSGVTHSHYPDALFWESLFDAETASDEEKEAWRVQTKTRLRKSFSIDEELKLVQWFSSLDPITAAGEEIGLLLMFTLGLRNNEACGANYGSIHPLQYHSDAKVFDMLQSTKLNSSELKSGGKTGNAPRTLLMMRPVWAFIQQRKEYLEAQIQAGSLGLPEFARSVEDLPLVCRKSDYTRRVGSVELANAGRALFQRIGIDQSELSALFQILCSSEMQQLQIEEKEPTTYLFRRNCATHLYQLGFSPSEIQYWMGHEIEDPFTKRSFFADPDQLYALKEKWDRHPVLKLMESEQISEVAVSGLPYRCHTPEHSRVSLTACNDRQLLVCADVPEPMCQVSLSVHGDQTGLSASYRLIPRQTDYPRSASVTKAVNKAYRTHLANIKEVVPTKRDDEY